MSASSRLPTVRGELIVKPLREADKALGSEFANERFSTWSIWLGIVTNNSIGALSYESRS